MTPNQAQSIPAHVFEETGIVLLASGILLFQSTDVGLDGNFALRKKPCLLFFSEAVVLFSNTNLISLVIIKQELHKKY